MYERSEHGILRRTCRVEKQRLGVRDLVTCWQRGLVAKNYPVPWKPPGMRVLSRVVVVTQACGTKVDATGEGEAEGEWI